MRHTNSFQKAHASNSSENVSDLLYWQELSFYPKAGGRTETHHKHYLIFRSKMVLSPCHPMPQSLSPCISSSAPELNRDFSCSLKEEACCVQHCVKSICGQDQAQVGTFQIEASPIMQQFQGPALLLLFFLFVFTVSLLISPSLALPQNVPVLLLCYSVSISLSSPAPRFCPSGFL